MFQDGASTREALPDGRQSIGQYDHGVLSYHDLLWCALLAKTWEFRVSSRIRLDVRITLKEISLLLLHQKVVDDLRNMLLGTRNAASESIRVIMCFAKLRWDQGHGSR